MISWVIQKEPFQENFSKLKEEVCRQGHDFYQIHYNTRYDRQDVPDLPETTVFYGSLEFAQKLRKQTNWIGVFCDLPQFKCSNYYPELSEFLLNVPYCMFPLGDYYKLRPYLFKSLGNNADLFIRPDSGFKLFTGNVIGEQESLDHFLGGKSFQKTDLALAGKPAKIWREWRLVVCDKRVIAASQYQNLGLFETSPDCPLGVLEFGNRIAKIWQPEPAYVMDVAETEDGFFLLELNSFSCSGLYECDMGNVVENISKLVLSLKDNYGC